MKQNGASSPVTARFALSCACMCVNANPQPADQPPLFPSSISSAKQGLVDDITSASTTLLELSPTDASQFRQQLDEQFFGTSVGSVWPGGAAEGAFEEVRGVCSFVDGAVGACCSVASGMSAHPHTLTQIQTNQTNQTNQTIT